MNLIRKLTGKLISITPPEHAALDAESESIFKCRQANERSKTRQIKIDALRERIKNNGEEGISL